MAALAAPFYTQAGASLHRTVSPDINVGCRFPPSSSIISLSIWSPPPAHFNPNATNCDTEAYFAVVAPVARLLDSHSPTGFHPGRISINPAL